VNGPEQHQPLDQKPNVVNRKKHGKQYKLISQTNSSNHTHSNILRQEVYRSKTDVDELTSESLDRVDHFAESEKNDFKVSYVEGEEENSQTEDFAENSDSCLLVKVEMNDSECVDTHPSFADEWGIPGGNFPLESFPNSFGSPTTSRARAVGGESSRQFYSTHPFQVGRKRQRMNCTPLSRLPNAKWPTKQRGSVFRANPAEISQVNILKIVYNVIVNTNSLHHNSY